MGEERLGMLSRTICLPPPNLFPFIAGDPSVAVWRISLACALLLGAETLLLWRARSLREVLLPIVITFGCFGSALAAWLQSRAFIQVVCATSLHLGTDEHQRSWRVPRLLSIST